VYSCVTSLETEDEFYHSVQKYNVYFESVRKKDFGKDHLSKELEKVIGRVISKLERTMTVKIVIGQSNRQPTVGMSQIKQQSLII
jgi:predicted secreted protein